MYQHPTSDIPHPTSPTRPELDERREYLARGRQEEFIVPLLRAAIEQAIADAPGSQAKSGRRALDVGCGGQPFRASIERAGYVYLGVDTQAQPGVKLDFTCAIDEQLPDALDAAAGAGFDLVLCTEVLEHVLDWPAAWGNLRRLLASDGRLIVTCPHIYPLHEEPYDFWRPTPHALRRFAERFGLEVVEQRQLGDGFDALGTINAACTPDPARRGPGAWLAAALARKGRKLLHQILKARLTRRLLAPRGKLYIANFIVLRKPDAAPTGEARA